MALKSWNGGHDSSSWKLSSAEEGSVLGLIVPLTVPSIGPSLMLNFPGEVAPCLLLHGEGYLSAGSSKV